MKKAWNGAQTQDKKPRPPDRGYIGQITQEERDLIADYRKLSGAEKEAFISYLRALSIGCESPPCVPASTCDNS